MYRSSTPRRRTSRRTKRPNGSSPVRVITAVRRPCRAAATATFVALPPRNLPNEVTSSSPTPTCNGYRSTPTRPIVITSKSVTPPVPPRSCNRRRPYDARSCTIGGESCADLVDAYRTVLGAGELARLGDQERLECVGHRAGRLGPAGDDGGERRQLGDVGGVE